MWWRIRRLRNTLALMALAPLMTQVNYQEDVPGWRGWVEVPLFGTVAFVDSDGKLMLTW